MISYAFLYIIAKYLIIYWSGAAASGNGEKKLQIIVLLKYLLLPAAGKEGANLFIIEIFINRQADK